MNLSIQSVDKEIFSFELCSPENISTFIHYLLEASFNNDVKLDV